MEVAKIKRYEKYIQLTLTILPEIIISLPKVDENETGFKFEIVCIQVGKFSLVNRAVLANMRGRFMKLATTVGICQSELFIVKNRYTEERPKLSRNNDIIKAVIPNMSGICTPNNITPAKTIGTCSIPRVEAPNTFDKNMV
jgi:hypothetical protein